MSLTAKGSRSPLAESHKAMFPFKVRWDVWEAVVVYIVEEGSLMVNLYGGETNEALKEKLALGGFEDLIQRIEVGVRERLVVTGLIAGEE